MGAIATKDLRPKTAVRRGSIQRCWRKISLLCGTFLLCWILILRGSAAQSRLLKIYDETESSLEKIIFRKNERKRLCEIVDVPRSVCRRYKSERRWKARLMQSLRYRRIFWTRVIRVTYRFAWIATKRLSVYLSGTSYSLTATCMCVCVCVWTCTSSSVCGALIEGLLPRGYRGHLQFKWHLLYSSTVRPRDFPGSYPIPREAPPIDRGVDEKNASAK